MASSANIFEHVKKWEGGLVQNAGEDYLTNMGITYPTYERLASNLLGHWITTKSRFKALTPADLQKFITYYWNKATDDNTIVDQGTANLFFEAFWMSGGAGIKDLQRAFGVTPDGSVGKNTVIAVNNMPGKTAEKIAARALAERFTRLGNQTRYAKFKNGWMNRLKDLTGHDFFLPAAKAGGVILLALLAFAFVASRR